VLAPARSHSVQLVTTPRRMCRNQDAAGVEVEEVLVVGDFALDNLWLECAL